MEVDPVWSVESAWLVDANVLATKRKQTHGGLDVEGIGTEGTCAQLLLSNTSQLLD